MSDFGGRRGAQPLSGQRNAVIESRGWHRAGCGKAGGDRCFAGSFGCRYGWLQILGSYFLLFVWAGQTVWMTENRKAVVKPNSIMPLRASSAPISCQWGAKKRLACP